MRSGVLLIFLFLFLLFPTTNAQTTLAPSWMKPGTYAQYQFISTGIAFTNQTILEFKNNSTCTFQWKCTALKNQIATLNISLIFSGKQGFTLSKTVNVNLTNRHAFLTNGTLIGATFLWGPTNITDGQTITLWDNPPEKIQGTATILGNGATPQGPQKAYAIQTNGTILGKQTQIIKLYDQNTGLFIDGHLTNDVLLTVTDIDYFGINGIITFSKTNVNLGQSEQKSNTDTTIMIVTIFGTVFILFLTTYYKQKKHNKMTKNNKKR